MGNATTVVREEAAKLCVYAGSESDPFHKPAFYNPRMAFNRSVSSLALGACNKFLKKFDNIVLVDGLCATGARGIRYALENKFVEKVFFVDANPDALELLEKNCSLNKLGKKSEVTEKDLNKFFEEGKREFDFVEIDPFGTPEPFIENALAKVREGGVLSVTATDLAALCGKEIKVCVRNYDSKPMRCGFSHEIALRILLKRIFYAAQEQDKTIIPFISFFEGHAIKAVCVVRKKTKAKKMENEIGFVSLCRKCLNRSWGAKISNKCGNCGSKTDYAGPLWLGKLCEKKFLQKMLETLAERSYSEHNKLLKILAALVEENDLPPFYFDLHDLASAARKEPPKTREMLERLKKKGFAAGVTHFSTKGVRSSASAREITELF